MARELDVSLRFKLDYGLARSHPDFERETVEYVFDLLIQGGPLPDWCREHPLNKGSVNWAGYWECHIGPDLVMIFEPHDDVVRLHRIGGHNALFAPPRRRRAPLKARR